MKDLLIRDVKAVNPSDASEEFCDVMIVDGRISRKGKNLIPTDNMDIIEASGLTLIPGLVDIHTHLRDPGFIDKEDIVSGCKAAAAGGVTTLLCMPNTRPVTDSGEIIRYILNKAGNAGARVLPVAAITKSMAGDEITDMKSLHDSGAVAFSDDGVPVKTAALMAQALKKAAELGVTVLAHCEDKSLAGNGIVNENVADKLSCPGIPVCAEDVGTAREIAVLMSAPSNAKLHICHVSTANSVKLIRDAKKNGLNISAETAPHYFIFNDDKVLSRDADYRMNPPLRSESDRKAVLEALVDGTIDCIATDHAPHTAVEKSNFFSSPNGVIGMETSFSASYTALVKTGLMTLSQLVNKMAAIPSEIIGLEGGTLNLGSRADVVLIDENEMWTVDPEHLHGKSKNCVFKGCELQSKVKMTVLGGRIVYNETEQEK